MHYIKLATYGGSEVPGLLLNSGGITMDLLLFIDTPLGPGDFDLCLFLLLILKKYKKIIFKYYIKF